LKALQSQGRNEPDPSGLTPPEQLGRIARRVRTMVSRQYDCLLNSIEPALAARACRREQADSLTPAEYASLEERFARSIEPVVAPIAIGRSRSMPLLRSLGLHLLVRLRRDPPGESRRMAFAVVPLDVALDRIVPLDARGGFRYILLEDVVRLFAGRLFAGHRVVECVAFRITRNADMAVDEDGDVDLLAGMEEVLVRRRKAPCVRLELEAGATRLSRQFLARQLEMAAEDVYEVPGPLNLADFMAVATRDGLDSLRPNPWRPRQVAAVDSHEGMFAIIAARDILLSHPYETFDPVIKLVQEAAEDDTVLAIKMTLYRTSHQSPIVDALCRAAAAGKYVTAVVELKARFDEHRNILWSRRLEDNGVHVVYGVRGLKTHAKVCLIVRQETAGIVRYMHFGTGNYNDVTARLYTDVGIMTRDEDLGQDATAFFNAITGYSVDQRFLKLVMAPSGLRERILSLIRDEVERKQKGRPGLIMAKMNALVDVAIIRALYEASQKGVVIRLNVRGICCLCPGVPGLSENIRVVSIVDRFLEHSRVFYFAHGGEDRVFISSADWMPRNLDRRVELLIPIEDRGLRRRLIHELNVCCEDTVKGREMRADGSYSPPPAGPAPEAVPAQEFLCREAAEREQEMAQHRRTVFEPHRPVRDRS
ncbi:MAG: polyphosphate kinase 1, partial [Lentisphaeria bacterium]|nr:polyphosphate kinase 1 [Lentisphaeria bacterium]